MSPTNQALPAPSACSEELLNKVELMLADAPEANDAHVWRGLVQSLLSALKTSEQKSADLMAALEPFASHAEGWTRKGYVAEEPLFEDSWSDSPKAEEGEPEYLDIRFLNVGHLIEAQKAAEKYRCPAHESTK